MAVSKVMWWQCEDVDDDDDDGGIRGRILYENRIRDLYECT